MKKLLTSFLIILVTVTLAQDYDVQMLDSTQAVLETPESVNFDPVRDFLFVSNIGVNPSAKDGKGFISIIDKNGNIIEKKWVTGLNAPKGAGIYGNILYVTDIDRIVGINIDSASIEETYSCSQADFLNDLAIDSSGVIYFSDSSPENSVVYRLKNGKIERWLTGEQVSQPNGLLIHKGFLYFGNSGDQKINRANLETGQIEMIAETGTGIDGLKIDHQGNFIISNWRGQTTLITPDGDQKVLLNTTQEGINAADLEYIPKERLLFIPTFHDDRVMIYKINY
ncbi:MAG TPA: SMP-30/gluconolactonase/LRE family protein [bacterium]|nr:SMP-30/gluconolactonase/LRE family protein [bacterium]